VSEQLGGHLAISQGQLATLLQEQDKQYMSPYTYLYSCIWQQSQIYCFDFLFLIRWWDNNIL